MPTETIPTYLNELQPTTTTKSSIHRVNIRLGLKTYKDRKVPNKTPEKERTAKARTRRLQINFLQNFTAASWMMKLIVLYIIIECQVNSQRNFNWIGNVYVWSKKQGIYYNCLYQR